MIQSNWRLLLKFVCHNVMLLTTINSVCFYSCLTAKWLMHNCWGCTLLVKPGCYFASCVCICVYMYFRVCTVCVCVCIYVWNISRKLRHMGMKSMLFRAMLHKRCLKTRRGILCGVIISLSHVYTITLLYLIQHCIEFSPSSWFNILFWCIVIKIIRWV